MSSDTDIDSDIIYLNILGQPIIILNSVKSAVDLIDKRGAIYSDRPSFVLLEAYVSQYLPPLQNAHSSMSPSLGFTDHLALLHDGPKWRKARKAYHNFLSVRGSLAYRDVQLKHARDMAAEIEKCPEKWQSYLSR